MIPVSTGVDPAERERHWTILMEQSLQGDARAYEQLLTLLTVGLRAVVRRRAHAAGIDTEDIVQEVLLALHLKRGTWARGTPLAPWVAAIARNKVVDAIRRRGQYSEVSIDGLADALVSDSADNVEHTGDVSDMLARLSERQRDVVRAVSLEGYSAREAAERLQMSEVAVRVTLHRSLKALAAMFRTIANED
jgi:RNA polymerase sigma-70 factor (ECF subfamily)